MNKGRKEEKIGKVIIVAHQTKEGGRMTTTTMMVTMMTMATSPGERLSTAE